MALIHLPQSGKQIHSDLRRTELKLLKFQTSKVWRQQQVSLHQYLQLVHVPE